MRCLWDKLYFVMVPFIVLGNQEIMERSVWAVSDGPLLVTGGILPVTLLNGIAV